MKKALVVFLLAIFMATGAFAQTTVTGQAQQHFGLNMPFNDPFSMDDANWVFNFLNTQSFVQVNRTGENTRGFFRWRADGAWRMQGSVTLADAADLEIGFTELPWVNWSGHWLHGNFNGGAGAVNSTVNPYFLFRTMGFYAGISEAGAFHNATIGSSVSPGFFLGYAMPLDMMNLHFAFALRHTTDALAFMGTAQARAIALTDTLRLGVNAALYMNPQFGFFAISGGGFGALAQRASDDNLFVLECLLDFRLALPALSVDSARNGALHFSLGGVTNFAADHEGIGLQGALMLDIPFGPNFSIMPGVTYRTILNNDARDTLLIGANLRYSF